MPSPVPGYETLWNVLQDAFEQASAGKGKERHANDRPFDEQPLMSIGRHTGPGGPLFQVEKKAIEALGMFSRGEYDAAERELLGAINYAAATIMLIREIAQAEKRREVFEKVNGVPVAKHQLAVSPGPIPEGYYWDARANYFISDDGMRLYPYGCDFYEKWFSRRNEFSKLND